MGAIEFLFEFTGIEQTSITISSKEIIVKPMARIARFIKFFDKKAEAEEFAKNALDLYLDPTKQWKGDREYKITLVSSLRDVRTIYSQRIDFNEEYQTNHIKRVVTNFLDASFAKYEQFWSMHLAKKKQEQRAVNERELFAQFMFGPIDKECSNQLGIAHTFFGANFTDRVKEQIGDYYEERMTGKGIGTAA